MRAGVVEDVWLINLPSAQAAKAWESPISLLWIDGDHSYEGARRDFECFERFVTPDGLVAFDDATEPKLGPFRVIEEAVAAGRLERIAVYGKIAVLRRPSSPA